MFSDKYIILEKILMIPAILIAFTVHEYAHGIVSDKLGDKTARLQGRLTLNPIKHIDFMGFIMILILGFGWAKPIETNPSSYKNYYKDDLKVSFAGPIANLITAAFFALIYGVLNNHLYNLVDSEKGSKVLFFLLYIVTKTVIINSMLFLFNLLPVPGFDGFHIIRDLFPRVINKFGGNFYTYQMVFLAILLIPLPIIKTSIVSYIVGIPSYYIAELFLKIGSAI
ncbi:site-2 protease family protein [Haloimpatiens sp. FM7315]|uniref:site-2 protease family protein n=1 Tax=Haloimpatiens sp. FM7315 TaxID=3298609 RepID=UPI00370B0D65